MSSVTIVGADRIEYTTRLATEVCCACAVPFAMPDSLQRERRKNPGTTFYCPNGHAQHYTGKTEAEKLREQLEASRLRAERAETAAKRQRQRAVDAERSRTAYKAVATRQRNRIARGVCPCCNRYFPAMERHMTDKHPQYAGEPLVSGD